MVAVDASVRAEGAALKRFSLELGGKSATIVLPDADMDMVAATARFSGLINNGQSCVAQTRILVPRENQDRFVEALVADVQSLTIGDPRKIETFIGPLVSRRQRDRVTGYIEAGIADYWYKYVGLHGTVIGMRSFGESAPAELLFEHFGFTVAKLQRAADKTR